MEHYLMLISKMTNVFLNHIKKYELFLQTIQILKY